MRKQLSNFVPLNSVLKISMMSCCALLSSRASSGAPGFADARPQRSPPRRLKIAPRAAPEDLANAALGSIVSNPPLPLLRACLQFRRGRLAARQTAAAVGSGDGGPPASPAAAAALEGRLLAAHLVATPALTTPLFLLRLMEQRYSVGIRGGGTTPPTTITVITPHDVDAIFDALEARGSADGDPYWARVWPSAVALAERIAARPELVAGKRVADLGAGLGVAGLAAALAGAREVVLLDREPLALECARLSAEATGGGAFEVARPTAAAAVAAEGGGGSSVAVVAVDGDAGHADGRTLRPLTSIQEVLGGGVTAAAADPPPTLQHQQQHDTPAGRRRPLVRAEPFDWHTRPLAKSLRRRFDVVLACDVLYERDAAEPLAEVVPLLLSDDNAPDSNGGAPLLLLADPPARTAENRVRFLELLGAAAAQGQRRRRFVVEEAALEQCAPRQLDRELLGGVQDGKPVPVQLLHLRAVNDLNDTIGVKAGAF